jgi:hypothetical protein
MRWRPAEITDKMRRSIGSHGKSVCNTQSGRRSHGNGSKQSMLWYVIAVALARLGGAGAVRSYIARSRKP